MTEETVQLANESEPLQPALLAQYESAEPVVEPAPAGSENEPRSDAAARETAPMEPAASPIAPANPAPQPSPLRAVYVLIFLVALLATDTVWQQAGGQGHLDLMPWYWKLFPPVLFSYAVVRASASAVRGASGWNRKAIFWLTLALFFAGLIGGLTYYYHLQESVDAADSDDGVVTSLMRPPGLEQA